MRTLFGTDGIRGRADEFPLDDPTMFALGQALGHRLQAHSANPLLLLGMDTRQSGPRIARALAAGITAGGGWARLIGVVPTPAVAYLSRIIDAAAGISISASHNPFEDNGVKVFGHDGMKLSDALEKEIEDELLALRDEGAEVPAVDLPSSPDLVRLYEDFLCEALGEHMLEGRVVWLDAGNGAAFEIAPRVFRRVGADVRVMNAEPDGRNINLNSGALHPEGLAAAVRADDEAALGVAFDGDADRAIFVDDKGNIRNGDEILYLWATTAERNGTLEGNTVVATVMSNLGFEKKLAADGIRLLRAPVGDKYVLEMMIANGALLGGEQSGHVIDLAVHTTGDGVHTGLVISDLVSSADRPFSQLETFEPMPQVLINQRVRAKPSLHTLPGYTRLLAESEDELGDRGRILVRYSGTENLVRVMVEGESQASITRVAERLRQSLEQAIGE
ncbi:MAG: phosphoglucosamine mutase [Acidobacteriota bacterium]